MHRNVDETIVRSHQSAKVSFRIECPDFTSMATVVKCVNLNLLPVCLSNHLSVMDELVSIGDVWVSDLFVDWSSTSTPSSTSSTSSHRLRITYQEQLDMLISSTRPLILGFL